MSTSEELKQEAKDKLNLVFIKLFKIEPSSDDTVSIRLTIVDEIVDCIIEAAVMEVVEKMKAE